MTEPIAVYLVDDDPMVLAALSMMLAGADDLTVVGQAGDGQQAVDALSTGAAVADVVLMDIRMPVRDGLWATEALLQLPLPPRVIAVWAGPQVAKLTASEASLKR